MGRKKGALKRAAAKLGLTFQEYQEKTDSGLKRCYKCKAWRSHQRFDIDNSRWDSLTAACSDCRRVQVRRKRVGSPPSKKAQSQASSAVSYEIKCGRIIKAVKLPCTDCGENADVYHHHLGYARRHWLDVLALCHSCHFKRHWD